MAFPTTRWTLVVSAQAPEAERRRALDELLGIYWQPLFVYMRRRGLDEQDAGEAVQDLLADLVSKDFPARVEPERGRLRSYLLRAASNQLANRHERKNAQKRGGGQAPLPLHDVAVPAEGDPEAAYLQAWAGRVMSICLERLRDESGERWAVLAAFFGPAPPPYRQVAAEHGMSIPALKAMLNRARKRYRALVAAEIAETGDDLAELMAAL